MRKLYFIITALFLMAIIINNINARMNRVSQIPNGNKFNCANCHINSNGGGARNPFGMDVEKNLVNGNVNWNVALANLDSDSDGFTNGQELLDPDGLWTTGTANPGNQNNVGNPGDESSTPIISSIEEIASSFIQINPNPVKDNAILSFSTKDDMNATISLISLNGAVVNILFDGRINAGQFNLNWQPVDASGNMLPAGIYLVSISSDGQSIARRIVVE